MCSLVTKDVAEYSSEQGIIKLLIYDRPLQPFSLKVVHDNTFSEFWGRPIETSRPKP